LRNESHSKNYHKNDLVESAGNWIKESNFKHFIFSY